MGTFWIVIGIAAGLLAIGWIGYGIWCWREDKLEKEAPEIAREKKEPEHLKEVRESFDDYTEKLAGFKRKTYEKEDLE